METEGTYRVLGSTRADDEWLLLDAESADPTYVPATGYDDLADAVDSLRPGYRVHATLAWQDDEPRFAELTVETETCVRFVRTEETMFRAAERCWDEAAESDAAMNARVTHSTDGEPNGVVYTFAEQPGQRDLFEEFRDGVKPLDPLLARAAESVDPPFDVTVLDHPGHPFVAVYTVFDPDSFLAETVRDTYAVDGTDGESDDDDETESGDSGSLADRLG